MNNIAEQLSLAYQQLQHYNKPDKPILLLAVSKTFPVSDIQAAYAAGQRHFGENYPQELADKTPQLPSDICWHFIGPLQSNKTRLVAGHASWVHSIDRLKIAERLSAQRPEELAPLKVLLQINISNEQSKAGITPSAMLELAAQLTSLPNIELKGLMAIPAPSADQAVQAEAFAAMQQLSQQLQQHYPNATELSMGMSNDWLIALRYGATMIRLGSAIFGARNYV